MGGSRRSAKPCSFAVARHSLLNLMKPIRIGCIFTDLIFSHDLEFPTFHAKQLTSIIDAQILPPEFLTILLIYDCICTERECY
jgi:hypothetical protein